MEDLRNQISKIELLIKNETDKTLKEIFKKNLKELEIKLDKRIESLNKNNNSKTLNQIKKIKIELQKATDNNDLQKYKELKKELKQLTNILKENNGIIKHLTTVQIKKILRVIKAKSNNVTRDKLLIILGFELGARATEILDLEIKNFNFVSGEVLLFRNKGSNESKLELKQEVIKLLNEHIQQNNITKYLFLNSKGEKLSYEGLNYIVKRYFELANIEKDLQHFHTLKHSRGIFLAENGFSIQAIQFLLGHKNIENTMIYINYSKIQNDFIFKRLETLKNGVV